VVNTRTPVWDIKGTGDIRVKLDTDVSGQEWYVFSDDSGRAEPLEGMVSCRAFPHFNGAHDQFRYEPVAFCFKTFAALLEAHPTESIIWAYDLEEYHQRVRMLGQQQEEEDQGDLRGTLNTLLGDLEIDL
jgi:hypothetical protein